MCGLMGHLPQKNVYINVELSAARCFIGAHVMKLRGRTSHGVALFKDHKSLQRYNTCYKTGSGYGCENHNYINDFVVVNSKFSELGRLSGYFMHERSASTGYALEEPNRQPVIHIRKDKPEEYFIIIHNGTIFNIDSLLEKYDVKETFEKGISDSLKIGYLIEKGNLDWLKEYNGTATLLWYDSMANLFFLWTGKSLEWGKTLKEEREFFITKKAPYMFASTKETLVKLGFDSEDVTTLERNYLYKYDPNTSILSKEGHYDRSASFREDQSYVKKGAGFTNHSKAFGYGTPVTANYYDIEDETGDRYSDFNRTKNKPKTKLAISTNNSKSEPESLEKNWYLSPNPIAKHHYPFNPTDMTNHFARHLNHIKGSLKNKEIINLAFGLYWTNNAPMHSQVLVGNDVSKHHSIPFLIGGGKRGDSERSRIYFWKGLPCNNLASFTELLKLETTRDTVSPQRISELVMSPNYLSLHQGEVLVEDTLYFKGKSLFDTDENEFSTIVKYPIVNIGFELVWEVEDESIKVSPNSHTEFVDFILQSENLYDQFGAGVVMNKLISGIDDKSFSLDPAEFMGFEDSLRSTLSEEDFKSRVLNLYFKQ